MLGAVREEWLELDSLVKLRGWACWGEGEADSAPLVARELALNGIETEFEILTVWREELSGRSSDETQNVGEQLDHALRQGLEACVCLYHGLADNRVDLLSEAREFLDSAESLLHQARIRLEDRREDNRISYVW